MGGVDYFAHPSMPSCLVNDLRAEGVAGVAHCVAVVCTRGFLPENSSSQPQESVCTEQFLHGAL